jgi:hypothetical protein
MLPRCSRRGVSPRPRNTTQGVFSRAPSRSACPNEHTFLRNVCSFALLVFRLRPAPRPLRTHPFSYSCAIKAAVDQLVPVGLEQGPGWALKHLFPPGLTRLIAQLHRRSARTPFRPLQTIQIRSWLWKPLCHVEAAGQAYVVAPCLGPSRGYGLRPRFRDRCSSGAQPDQRLSQAFLEPPMRRRRWSSTPLHSACW